MLAVAVHEQQRAALRVIQARHQGGFLAEIARQRNHLHVQCDGGKRAGEVERVIGAAVIDINDFAGEAEALPQLYRKRTETFVQLLEPGGFVVNGDDDRQTLRGRGGLICRQTWKASS